MHGTAIDMCILKNIGSGHEFIDAITADMYTTILTTSWFSTTPHSIQLTKAFTISFQAETITTRVCGCRIHHSISWRDIHHTICEAEAWTLDQLCCIL